MPAGSQVFQVGSIRCTALSDGYLSYPTEWFFPDADAARLADSMQRLRLPQERVMSPYTCLLIESGREVILVDTGNGDTDCTSGAIRARLDLLGIRAADVNTVVLTHAHPDHIGGAVDRNLRPVFENAQHLVGELEWEFWMGSRPNLAGMDVPADLKGRMAVTARHCLDALRFQIETIDGEYEVIPGVRLIPAAGHTPGHLALLISSDGEHLLNLGDAAVHPIHLEEPGWRNGFDLAPVEAGATRRELLERAVSESMHVMAAHFPFPSAGRVAPRSEGGWGWSPGW